MKSGDVVRVGTPLVQIDPDKQQAAVRSTEANRSGAVADVQYWRQQVTRLEALVTAGAVSRLELEQAQNSLKTAEAKLAAIDAQVSEERVQLQYYRVVAPQAGVVGDIPIRVGDRVTQSTVITTVDENSSLEAYIQVPVDRAPELRMGLPVQLLDADGKAGRGQPDLVRRPAGGRVHAVGPRQEPAEGRAAAAARAAVRAGADRLEHRQGLTVPVVAVSRLSGQYFCFVAEQQDKGLVARQRPVQVGEVLGDDYVVAGGLKAGDRDRRLGHPEARATASADHRRSNSMFVDTFIRRPILASVCSLVLILAGAIAIPTMPVAQYPPLAPPVISVTTFYTGADAQAVETAVTTPLEQAINGVEGMLYMTSSSTNSGAASISVVFDVTRDVDIAAVDVQNRVSTALARLPTRSPHERRHRPEGHDRLRAGGRACMPRRGSTIPSSSATTSTST